VTAGLTFVASLLTASPRLDIRLFGSLHGAAAAGLFTGAFCWVFYMAIEPFIRRQWPRVLIGWSRLMAGEWRDPQVGREVFLGAWWAIVAMIPAVVAGVLVVQAGDEPMLKEMFYFRGLGGVREMLGGLLKTLPWSVFVGLMWVLLLLMFRRLLRSDALAVGAMALLTLALAPSTQWVTVAAMFIANLVALMVAVRIGFLSLVTLIVVGHIVESLPLSPGAPGIVGSLSWMSLAAIIIPTGFALYTSLAGQSIFGDAE
jgi:serine/threonine-protein kinase